MHMIFQKNSQNFVTLPCTLKLKNRFMVSVVTRKIIWIQNLVETWDSVSIRNSGSGQLLHRIRPEADLDRCTSSHRATTTAAAAADRRCHNRPTDRPKCQATPRTRYAGDWLTKWLRACSAAIPANGGHTTQDWSLVSEWRRRDDVERTVAGCSASDQPHLGRLQDSTS